MSFVADAYLVEYLLEFKKKYNYSTIVETGTHLGGSTKILSNIFDKVYTCELMEEYFSKWEEIENNPKIEIFKESSVTFLPKVFTKIGNDNFYLYLDAHGVVDETGHIRNPILTELEIVAQFNYKPIIMIHDFDSKKDGWQFDKIYNFELEKYINLDWDYIKDGINKIYGENGYILHTNSNSNIARTLLTIIPKNLENENN